MAVSRAAGLCAVGVAEGADVEAGIATGACLGWTAVVGAGAAARSTSGSGSSQATAASTNSSKITVIGLIGSHPIHNADPPPISGLRLTPRNSLSAIWIMSCMYVNLTRLRLWNDASFLMISRISKRQVIPAPVYPSCELSASGMLSPHAHLIQGAGGLACPS